jgi:polar amino acid transport system substrate-binding protein
VQDIVGHTTEVASVSYMTDIYNNYNDAHPDEQIDLVYVDDVSNTPLNVSEGRVDFELFTKLTLQNQIESAGLDNVKLIDVSLEDYDFLTGGDEGINGTFFLAAKGNEQLIEDMNEAFEAAVEDGSIAKINEKYLGQSDEYAITLDYIEHVKELVQKDVEENGGQEDE